MFILYVIVILLKKYFNKIYDKESYNLSITVSNKKVSKMNNWIINEMLY